MVINYNPLDWGGNGGWKCTADSSFLFNFTDGKNISTAELSYSNPSYNSVYCHDSYGPHTNQLQYSSNNGNNWSYNYNSAYNTKIGIPSNFTVENYEVFQVIK